LSRPVWPRASRTAFSTASVPPFVKNTMSRSPGASSAISRAASLRMSFAMNGAIVHNRAACSWMAATSFGCWWPMFTFTSWLAKSSQVRPFSSHMRAPRAPAITVGLSAPCADQEWNTCARSFA